MKCTVPFLCVLATLAILVPSAVCDRAEQQELALRRNRRTVQFLVNHFVHFFGLSGAGAGNKKIEPKQDNVFSLPLTNILKASAGKFSGASGPKQKPAVPAEREPTLQHDLPTWIDDRTQKISNPYSEAFEADSLEPTRVSLLSTTSEPEETTTTSTTTTTELPTTTTTEEPAPIAPTEAAESEAPEPPTTTTESEEPATSASSTEDTPQEGSSSSTEASSIDPDDVNRLSDSGFDVRSDARDQSFQPTPIPLVSYQHYVQPAIWPAAGTGFHQHAFPMQQYFGNNVFIPAQHTFPLASPFQVQAHQAPPVQSYPTNQPVYDNRLSYYQTGSDSQPKSHSRVKLHDNHYDLFTYHDDTEPAASNYQVQSFGNYRNRRY